jgi:hypothetical protein
MVRISCGKARRTISLAVVALALTSACLRSYGHDLEWGSASPDPTPINLLPAKFANESGATDAVRIECDLQHLVPEWIAHFTPVPVVLALEPDDAPRVLDLTLTSVVASPGGIWSGPKQLDVHGDLIDRGQVVASFDARRTTVTGGWAAGGGTCDVLDYVSESIGRDLRTWLRHPVDGAQLGELEE